MLTQHCACSHSAGNFACLKLYKPEAVPLLLQVYESRLRILHNDILATLDPKQAKQFYRGPKVGMGASLAPVVHAEQGSMWSSPVSLAQHVPQCSAGMLGPACLRWQLRGLRVVLMTRPGQVGVHMSVA